MFPCEANSTNLTSILFEDIINQDMIYNLWCSSSISKEFCLTEFRFSYVQGPKVLQEVSIFHLFPYMKISSIPKSTKKWWTQLFLPSIFQPSPALQVLLFSSLKFLKIVLLRICPVQGSGGFCSSSFIVMANLISISPIYAIPLFVDFHTT